MVCWRVANQWLLSGKKICRPITWQKHSYWFKGDSGIIMYGDGTPAEVHLNQIRADDWEIWEDEKSLSDEIIEDGWECLCVTVDKLKKAVKRLREELLIDGSYCREIDNKIIEIFGTKLTDKNEKI